MYLNTDYVSPFLTSVIAAKYQPESMTGSKCYF